jgi:predicted small secreted protein
METSVMTCRFLLIAAALSCAGCNTADTLAQIGRDALGLPVFALNGDRLSQLEAIANTYCAGGTRPYYRSVTGTGENVGVTYTCE